MISQSLALTVSITKYTSPNKPSTPGGCRKRAVSKKIQPSIAHIKCDHREEFRSIKLFIYDYASELLTQSLGTHEKVESKESLRKSLLKLIKKKEKKPQNEWFMLELCSDKAFKQTSIHSSKNALLIKDVQLTKRQYSTGEDPIMLYHFF